MQLNATESRESLATGIREGKWDIVLSELPSLELPLELLVDVYEHIFLEMMEKGERSLCSRLLHECTPLVALQSLDPLSNVRYRRLESMISIPELPQDLYRGQSRQARRKEMTELVSHRLHVVQRSRLLKLLNNGLKWEHQSGEHGRGSGRIDIFTGELLGSSLAEAASTRIDKVIKFPKGSYPETVCFSSDGEFLVSGSSDGLVEVYDPKTGKLAMSFSYQATGHFLVHSSSVTALAFSNDGTMLASGDKNGDIKIWSFSSGKCLNHLQSAHRDGLTGLIFSPDDSGLLSSSLDTTARLHGVKSGKLLSELTGHNSFVTCIRLLSSGDVVTGSSDGFVRIFSSHTGKPQIAIPSTADNGKSGSGYPSVKGCLIAESDAGGESIIVCPYGRCGYHISSRGDYLGSFDSGKENDDFVALATSPGKSLVYFASERGNVYCFNFKSRELIHSINICEADITAIAHNPRRSLLAVTSTDGKVYIIGR